MIGRKPGNGQANGVDHGVGPFRPQRSRRRVGLLAVSWIAVLSVLTGGASFMTGGAGSNDVAVGNPQAPGTPGAAAAPLLSVSLTFDGARSSQREAARILGEHQLRGTFFVNSGFIGSPGFMSLEDLHGLAEQHHEIGGHTVTLADLNAVEPDEAQRQVCGDRARLSEWGFKVTSFAYPFGSSSPSAQEVVSRCGYNSARGLDSIRSPLSCPTCGPSETVRPENAFNTRATAEVGSAWTLEGLQQTVERAETSGGWLQLAFYDVDDSGTPQSITPALFGQFAAWLESRTAAGTMGVRTVHEVIGQVAQPVVPGEAAKPAGPGVNALRNPGLEVPGKYGLPQCWQVSGYGENSSELATLAPGFRGGVTRRLDVTGYRSGDVKLLPVLDLGACSPSVTAGRTYSLRAWYQSTAATQYAVYYRTQTGDWKFWTASPYFPANSEYSQAVWETPPVPDGAEAISFGLNLFSDGQLATDDYEMYDTVGAPPPAQ
ncbi:polysaccharide deacetylase family protein [Pseudarthrobacter enclensis]|uniref:polysaccharide deacetylase family protein n=1 Tax=Pseudarthrobacter enclensis TaxID=993070 RepID=UPI003EE05E30